MPAFSSPSSTSPNQVLKALSPISLRSRSQTRTQCASSSFRPATSSILGPRHCLLFVCCVLVVAWHRRLNSVQVCLHGSPAAFHPPAVPRLALRIQGPLKAVRYVETCTVAGRGHGFRRRGRSSSTPTEKQQRRLLVGERARERGHEFRIGLHAGKDLPLEQRRLLGQRLEIGQADIVPFGARAHVDQDRVLVLAQDLPGRRRRHVAGIAGGGGHLVRAGDLVVVRHGPRSSFAEAGRSMTEPTIDGGHTARRGRRKLWMRVVEGTLPCFDRRCRRMAVALSLVRLSGEEEAPRLRLGSRLSAPRPVAMGRALRQNS